MAEAVSLTGREQDENAYSLEGSIFHGLAFIKASLHFGKIDTAEHDRQMREWIQWCNESDITADQRHEMQLHAKAYVAFLQERMDATPHGVIHLEQRVFPGVPHCWGTGDAIIIGPTHVEIIDAKYGQGVFVEVWNNPQLKIYGLGAYEIAEVLGVVEDVTYTVFQPRMDNISTATETAEDLLRWREEVVIPAAELALTEDAPFNPGEHCRWCPARGNCRARMEASINEDFDTPPETITPEELGPLLHRIPLIQQWCKDVQDAAFQRIYQDEETVPGWKVALTGGKRSIQEEAAAIEKLVAEGYDLEDVARPLPDPKERHIRTLGDLEKLVGKDKLPQLLGDLLKAPLGKPSLVPESHSAPSTNRIIEARKDFS